MIWTEQHKKDTGEYIYEVEDFFGTLKIWSKKRLDKYTLDLMQMHISKNNTGENKFILSRKNGIIEVDYKLIKNTKSLWEKLTPKELTEDN